MVEKFKEIEFLREAVQIDSTPDIKEMRDLVLQTLEKRGFQPRVDEAGNTLCSRGNGSPHLVLNTHIDTVKPHIEFSETDDRIKGRGSCDAKASLAVFLKSFIQSDIDGKLTLAITPDEETTLQGSKYLDLEADAVFVGEPTDLDPCIAARGWTKVEVEIKGRSAHASEPENGSNAIKEASRAILDLERFDEEFSYDNKILPDPNLTATIIEGGEAENQVPEECSFTIDRRTVPPETPEDFRQKIRQFLERNTSSEFEIIIRLPENMAPLSAFETDKNADIVEVIESVTNSSPRTFNAATEASRFNETNVVVFGPGKLADDKGGIAHSNREYVLKEDVRKAAKISISAVEEYLS